MSRVTADYFVRPGLATTGAGQISNLAQTDPPRYIANRLRILSKALPLPSDSPLLSALDQLRKKWWYLYLIALGEKYERLSRRDRARQYYVLAERQSPGETAVWRKLALLELQDRRPIEALSDLLSCLRSGAVEVGDYLYASLASLMMGKAKDALALLSELEDGRLEISDEVRTIIHDYRSRALRFMGQSKGETT